jgi:phage-related protein
MSTSLSIASVIEKNRLSSDVPWLICLDIDVIDPASMAVVETMRLVRNTEAITFNGFDYVPSNFDIELKSSSGEQQTVSVSINDYSLAIQKRMQDYGGGVGFKVSVMVVNAGNLAQPPEIIEYFEVVGASSNNYACSFTLGAENNLTKTFPRRRQMRDFCQWRYKSAECGYTGSVPTCDLSLQGPNGCATHDNVVRFGAYPGLSGRDSRYG